MSVPVRPVNLSQVCNVATARIYALSYAGGGVGIPRI